VSDDSIGTLHDEDYCFVRVFATSSLLPHGNKFDLQDYCSDKENRPDDDHSDREVCPG